MKTLTAPQMSNYVNLPSTLRDSSDRDTFFGSEARSEEEEDDSEVRV